MATRQDTFAGRTVATGWGTASDGNVWTTQSGDGQSVSSNEGRITSSSASTFNTLGAALSADTNTAVRWSINDTSSTHGILARFADTNNYYLARYDGAGHIAFFKDVAGTKTTVASVAFTPTTSTNYWLRFIVQGSTIQVRHWADGSSEPSTWDINTTDTSITAAGKAGLYGFNNFGVADTFDSFNAADVSSGSTITLSGTLSAGTALSGTLSTGPHLHATLSAAPALSAFLQVKRPLHATLADSPTLSGSLAAGVPGTHIGDLVSSAGSISWTGTSGSPGTEYRETYKDLTGSGWAVGSVPTYGGMPIGPVYAEEANVAEQEASLSTTQPGGHIHWLEQTSGGTWGGSEDPQFTRTELAPSGTAFRRYLQTTAQALDAAGIQWSATACIYPGDPGLIAYRFDLHNPGGSSVVLASTDGIEIALIGSLEQTDSVWSPTNGGYGTLSGSDQVGWPSALTNIEPDYVYIKPANTTTLGQATVKKTSLAGLGWANLQVQYLQNSSRLKFKVQADGMTLAAGATQTVYLLHVLRRNLTAPDIRAIAKDYLTPGAPSVAVGSFTSFSYDEIAYVFAASSSALTTTLDTTATRYKPRLKVTNFTGTTPKLTWGGAALTAGTDYRYTLDSANHVLYLHLYFDVVASGAGSGQRNVAALAVTDATVTLSGTLAPAPSLAGALAVTRPLHATLPAQVALSGTLRVSHPLHGTIAASSGLVGTLARTCVLRATLPSQTGLAGTLHVTPPAITLSATLSATPALTANLRVTRPLSAALSSQATLTGLCAVTRPLAATLGAGVGVAGTLGTGHSAALLALTLTDAPLAALAQSDSALATLTLSTQPGA